MSWTAPRYAFPGLPSSCSDQHCPIHPTLLSSSLFSRLKARFSETPLRQVHPAATSDVGPRPSRRRRRMVAQELNCEPSNPAVPVLHDSRKSLYFVGIGGAGLSALATLALHQGCHVSGSDLSDSPQLDALRRAGATVFVGHSSENLASIHKGPIGPLTSVIASSAIPANNPELAAACSLGIPIYKRGQWLEEVTNSHDLVSVAGSHGKTSTTAMLSVALAASGFDVTAIVGAHIPQFPDGGSVMFGTSKLFVLESDEYDNCFLHLSPSLAIITNVEWEHVDMFQSEVEVRHAFLKFVKRIRPGGVLLVCGDNAGCRAVANEFQTEIQHAEAAGRSEECLPVEIVTYGLSNENDWKAIMLSPNPQGGTDYVVVHQRLPIGKVTLPLAGTHNVLNSLAVVAASALLSAKLTPRRTSPVTNQQSVFPRQRVQQRALAPNRAYGVATALARSSSGEPGTLSGTRSHDTTAEREASGEAISSGNGFGLEGVPKGNPASVLSNNRPSTVNPGGLSSSDLCPDSVDSERNAVEGGTVCSGVPKGNPASAVEELSVCSGVPRDNPASAEGKKSTGSGVPKGNPALAVEKRSVGSGVAFVYSLRDQAAMMEAEKVLQQQRTVEAVIGSLSAYQGAARRFEVVGRVHGVVLVDDYAHHPSEVRASLQAARQRFDVAPIWVIFQPHTFSRIARLLDDFAESFGAANRVIVSEIYSAREKNEWAISGQDLAEVITGPVAMYVPSLDDIIDRLEWEIKAFLAENPKDKTRVVWPPSPGELVVISMGAGDNTRVCRELLERLSDEH